MGRGGPQGSTSGSIIRCEKERGCFFFRNSQVLETTLAPRIPSKMLLRFCFGANVLKLLSSQGPGREILGRLGLKIRSSYPLSASLLTYLLHPL